MLAAAHESAQSTGGKVVAVLLGHNAKGLAGNFAADQVLYLDHSALADFNPEAYLKALTDLIRKNQPRDSALRKHFYWCGFGQRALDSTYVATREFLSQSCERRKIRQPNLRRQDHG